MEQEIQNLQKKIDEQEIKIDAIYKSVEKIRKYFLMTIWVTVITVVLPLIALAFVIPAFMSNYVDKISGLGL